MEQRRQQTGILQLILRALQSGLSAAENWLWYERESLLCWLSVAFAGGIALWFLLPGVECWVGILLISSGLGCSGLLVKNRLDVLGSVLAGLGFAMAAGCAVIWIKSAVVAAPVLERAVTLQFTADVERVEELAAKEQFRLLLIPEAGQGLPPRVRVSIARQDQQALTLLHGDRIALRARLMPPPRSALPGGYDFARKAWFDGIGAVGRALSPPLRLSPRSAADPSFRDRLNRHVRSRLSGGAGAIAVALVTGDQGGIAEGDAEAMRRSGLAHLLSVSGLHVTAVVGGVMWLALRILALSPWLALRAPLTLWAAGLGGLAGVGYTLLTGTQVPTVRSLVAALLVMLALALGRQALSMRLVAAGVFIVLAFWPEALVGPSFQLSFAAIAAIVALHAQPQVQRLLERRDEWWPKKSARALLGLLMTGVAVELALMPIALFHFHKAGVYGALVNIIAIPLTTFVIMPMEALALLADAVGLGAPFWWVAGVALRGLLALAHGVASAPGAVASFPAMPIWAFAAMMGGGVWLLLWRSRARLLGGVPLLLGAVAAVLAPSPDILVTNDGRHVAVRMDDGRYAILRARSGAFVRDQLREAAGVSVDLIALDEQPNVRCSPDFCLWGMARDGRRWTVLAARSGYLTPWQPLIDACAVSDIVIADRRLPRGCKPKWFKADRRFLYENGGLAVFLNPPHVVATHDETAGAPWSAPATVMPSPSLTAQSVRHH